MGHYLYCLLAPPARGTLAQMQAAAAAVPTLGGDVVLFGVAGLIFVHCPCEAEAIAQTRRNMLAHTRMLEALMPLATCLPVRFGLIAQDLTEVGAMITERRAELERHSRKLCAHVEVGLRISFPRAEALAQILSETPEFVAERDRLQGQGRAAYFAQADFGRRLAEALDTRRTRAQKQLLAALCPHGRDHVLRAPETDVEVLRAEFLVPEAGVDSFARTGYDLAAGLGFAGSAEPEVQVVGPAPPYRYGPAGGAGRCAPRRICCGSGPGARLGRAARVRCQTGRGAPSRPAGGAAAMGHGSALCRRDRLHCR